MATPTPTPAPPPEQPLRIVGPAEEPTRGPLAGEPAIVGLPSFIVGAVALGMVLIGVVPAGTNGAALPIILVAAAGMTVASIWSAVIGQSAPAGIYGIVCGYFWSFALLVLGLAHNWFGVTPAAMADTQKVFVISWMVIVTMLVLATLRLPVAYTLLFTLIDVALLLDLLGIIQTSANLTKAAGWVVIAAAALPAYFYFGSTSHATGGKELPLGPPILHA
jgi:succinate-acetate transporter protein